MAQRITLRDVYNMYDAYPHHHFKLHMDFYEDSTYVYLRTYHNECLVSICGTMDKNEASQILRGKAYWENVFCTNGLWSADYAFET